MVCLACGTLAVCFALSLLWRHDDPDEFIRLEAEKVQQRTLPFDAHIVMQPNIIHRHDGIDIAWQIETRQTWPEYGKWVTGQLSGEFTPSPTQEEGRLRFSKQLPGDFLCVQVERAAGAPERIKIVFSGQAD